MSNLINIPTLVELTRPAIGLTSDDLNNTQHPINDKSISGKRSGMACMIGETVYLATGSSPSAPWTTVAGFNLDSSVTIKRLIDASSSVAVQNPTGLGIAGEMRVLFGADAISPEVTVKGGEVEVLESRLYRLKLSLQYYRATSGGTAVLLFSVRVGGITVEFQAGRSVVEKIINANSTSYFENDTWIYLPAGAKLYFFIMRDSSGANDGGIKGFSPTLSGGAKWNDIPAAALRIETLTNI